MGNTDTEKPGTEGLMNREGAVQTSGSDGQDKGQAQERDAAFYSELSGGKRSKDHYANLGEEPSKASSLDDISEQA